MTDDNRRPTLTPGGAGTLDPKQQPAPEEERPDTTPAEEERPVTKQARERRPETTVDEPRPDPITEERRSDAPPPMSDDDERSPESREQLRKLGLELVTRLFSASKTVRLYDMNNRAAQRSLGDFNEAVQQLLDAEGKSSMRVSSDLLLINDTRIAVDAQHYGPFEFVVEELKKRQVESIEFKAGVNPKELGIFLTPFYAIDPVESAYDHLQAEMEAASISAIVTTRLTEQEKTLKQIDKDTRNIREESNRVYFRTVALMGDILRTIEEKHILQVKKAKRLTQQMVDIIQMDESMLLGLTSIKNFDMYTFVHSVNVCILSMLIGDRLRLDKGDIAKIGVAALFHDIGKTYIPSTILNSTGPLNPREWELMKYHTFFGVKELSRMNALRDAIDPMFVALQHHVHVNNDGYPHRPGGWKLRLFTRIVTIADYFDAMTAYRTYQKEPITPDKALRFILEKSGDIFDPFISKVFIQAMGLYPIGTIVELDTMERAVVVRQNSDPRYLHRPVVEIVDATADASTEREIVDLTERSSGEYYFKRSVVRTYHDTEIEVDKRSHFVI
jgi:HD-GYP domain-containing protein (c-di-GMP phosphodiesterase class II)